jgi:hypothetical protein
MRSKMMLTECAAGVIDKEPLGARFASMILANFWTLSALPAS